MTYIKERQRVRFARLENGETEVVSDMYLTAYREYGCRTERIVSDHEADEIQSRLIRKGFEIIAR